VPQIEESAKRANKTQSYDLLPKQRGGARNHAGRTIASFLVSTSEGANLAPHASYPRNWDFWIPSLVFLPLAGEFLPEESRQSDANAALKTS
jgi:hypothetical protein